jgi:serine/arginine repetitive matrix protein 2
LQEGSPDLSNLEDGRALQVVELENGEVIWSVLDSLRDELEDDVRSNYFSNRGSYASHYSGTDDPIQVSSKGLGRSTSRAGTAPSNGSQKGVLDGNTPETKVSYQVSSALLVADRLHPGFLQ